MKCENVRQRNSCQVRNVLSVFCVTHQWFCTGRVHGTDRLLVFYFHTMAETTPLNE